MASSASSTSSAANRTNPTVPVTHHRTAVVDGFKIFYRQAGPLDAPVVLLLHGFPTSSHMFRNLIPALADRYHVIAPDYPGYGQSDMPDRAEFAYTFDRYAELVDGLLDQLGHASVHDVCHGLWRARGLAACSQASGPRGRFYRPERKCVRRGPQGILGSDQGLLGRRLGRQPEGIAAAAHARDDHFSIYRWRVRPHACFPDNWVHDQALLDRPGNNDIQLDLFYDYRTNLPLYPKVQAYFREFKPPMLIVWGKNDVIFPADGAYPYKEDLPDVETPSARHGSFRAGRQGGRDGAADTRLPCSKGRIKTVIESDGGFLC